MYFVHFSGVTVLQNVKLNQWLSQPRLQPCQQACTKVMSTGNIHNQAMLKAMLKSQANSRHELGNASMDQQ